MLVESYDSLSSVPQVGVLHEFTTPLKQAKIPIFVSSTFLTDYILVGEDKLQEAVGALKLSGWHFA